MMSVYLLQSNEFLYSLLSVSDTLSVEETGLLIQIFQMLGVYWYNEMIFAGSVDQAYMQTMSDLCFFLWLSHPAIDRWWENAGSLCSGSYARITNASHLIASSLWEWNWWEDSRSAPSWSSGPSGVWSAVISRREPMEPGHTGLSTPHPASRPSVQFFQIYLDVVAVSWSDWERPHKHRGPHICTASWGQDHSLCRASCPAHTQQAHKGPWDTSVTTHWCNTQKTGCGTRVHFSFWHVYSGMELNKNTQNTKETCLWFQNENSWTQEEPQLAQTVTLRILMLIQVMDFLL